MGSILIRNLDDRLKASLRVRAAEKGHSMEEEARAILRQELEGPKPPVNLAALAREIFGDQGVEFEVPPRLWAREPPDFSE